MKYFYDTEFLEGKQKRPFSLKLRISNWKFGYQKPTIDLISIGIVSEDNREYCAISKEFNLREAWNRFDRKEQTMFEKQNGFEGQKVYWIRENVLKPIFYELLAKFNKESKDSLEKGSYIGCIPNQKFSYKLMKWLLNRYGKSNKQIAEEIKNFIYTTSTINDPDKIGNWEEVKKHFPIDLYGYYSAYDHVVFCWLFGKMIDLPKGFPMYTRDLKQKIDESVEYLLIKGNSSMSFNDRLDMLKNSVDYPKQENEHNALADARWNKKLYEFLMSL